MENTAMQTITTQIQLDSTRYAALTEESKRRKIPVDELVNELVQQYLDEFVITQKGQPSEFMAIVGLGNSGRSDISKNHDHYLGEVIADEHLR